jgi:hypothetical protein
MRFEQTIGLILIGGFIAMISLIIFIPNHKPIVSEQTIDNKTYSCKLYNNNITTCEQLPPLNIKIINGTKYDCKEYYPLFSKPVLNCVVISK